jgi:hypothetical protein
MDKKLLPIQGFKYLSRVMPLLERLHKSGTKRDIAGNRQLHFDRYVALLLLYFFTPGLNSLRGLAQATALDKVAQATGGGSVSLGSLSEAPRVFDPTLLRGVLRQVATEAIPFEMPADRQALRDLTAVDGTLLRVLPRMAWAVWQDDTHRAAKAHVAFEVFGPGPSDATITHGNGSEREQLRTQLLKPGRIYVVDRGYESYELLADIRAKGGSFVARVQQDVAFEVQEERPIDDAARAAGVIRDVILKRLGTGHHKDWHKGQPLRLVVVENAAHRDGEPKTLYLLTDKVDWAAELVALAYRYRWSVELFFRWLKSILGCRHLLSNTSPGVAIQVYVALIASVLLGQWTGRKPDKRTFEMFCHFFSGLASEQELHDYLRKRQEKDEAKKRKQLAESSA